MTSFPTILTLWDTWIYVCTPNSSNIATNVKASVYKFFSLCMFQMSIHMINMLDFGKTLITLGLNTNTILLKIWLSLIIFSITSAVIGV